MKFVRHQLGYLFSGLIFWLPIGILIVAGGYIYDNLEETGGDFLDWFLPQKFLYTGLGTAFWIVVFFMTGLILRETALGGFLSGIPVLGLFFRKGGKTITFDKLLKLPPCVFLYSPTCLSYGWILSEQEVKLDDEKAHFILINVYYPNVPTIVMGQVYSVRKGAVMRLGNQSREIIDVLLYGLRRPENLRYLPWEDETEQEFKERANRFGLISGA